MRCAVFSCNNTNNDKSNPHRFYSFPREKQLVEKWINFCCRNDKFKYKTARICSAHFKLDDFERNMQYEMGLCQRNAFKLKPGTVPTLETANCKQLRTKPVQTGPGSEPEPVAISRVTSTPCPISCITVKAEPGEFIGDTNEPVAFIITAIKEEVNEEVQKEVQEEVNEEVKEKVKEEVNEEVKEETDISEIKIEAESITDYHVAVVDPLEFVDSGNHPSPPANQQLQDQIKALRKELTELRSNKIGLQKIAKRHASEIFDLKRRLVKAVYKRDNMQEKLLQIFSTEQVNSLKNGTDTQAWTEADIEQSDLLYSASSKAYKMLREKNFPLPTVETLTNWKKKKTDTSSKTEITTDAADSISSSSSGLEPLSNNNN